MQPLRCLTLLRLWFKDLMQLARSHEMTDAGCPDVTHCMRYFGHQVSSCSCCWGEESKKPLRR